VSADLLVATSNPGKLREFRGLLPASIRIQSLADVGLTAPPETGDSFQDIAMTKAQLAASAAQMVTLADDSGLEVDALGGAPGIRSARYAGDPPSTERNCALLLRQLKEVSREHRTARFVCVVALASPFGVIATERGYCHGHIAFEPSGSNGFGYDPLFLLPDGRSMASILEQEKNAISHRAMACRAILPTLVKTLGLVDEEVESL